jgi:hypothetical protein
MDFEDAFELAGVNPFGPGGGWEEAFRWASHLPQRMHDQEKLYSPPLKRTGGYSYMPEEAKESDVQKPEQQKARNYWPNFLLGLEPPPNGETLEQEQETEPPSQWQEPEPQGQDNKPQGNKTLQNGRWYYLNPRDGKYYDAKGNRLR